MFVFILYKMTLRDLFDFTTNNPTKLYYFFIGLPAISFLLKNLFTDPNKAYKIKWLFSIICFLAVIPGIFAITFGIYTFLFERLSILDINLLVQLLPILSMFVTLYFVKNTLPFEYIPGFEKLTTLATYMFGIMAILWIVDRTHIMAISIIPFMYIILGLLVFVLFVKYFLPKIF